MGYVEEVGEGGGKSILLCRGCKELTLPLMHRRRGSRSASAISRESCLTCPKLDWIRIACEFCDFVSFVSFGSGWYSDWEGTTSMRAIDFRGS